MVSIVVLNRNGGEHFKKCIQSVLSSTFQDFEILIRENTSTDGSKEWIDSIQDPRVRVFHKENTGNFSTMNNEVAQKARGDCLLFLNNDVFLDPRTLQNMTDILARDPYIGTVGALLRYPNGKIQHAGVVCGPSGDPVNLSSDSMHAFKINPVFMSDTWEHRAVTAACLLIKKEDFWRVEGFDPQYNWAYEDVDLGLKVHFHLNKKNVVSPECTGVHIEGASKANPNLPENLRKFQARWASLFTPDCDSVPTRRYEFTQLKELSFVVCTNDFHQLNNILVRSLYKNRHRYEIIPVYNFKGTYSAAQALNLGATVANTDWLVFTHQDVEYSDDWVDQMFSQLKNLPKFGVAGLAGVKKVTKTDRLAVPIVGGQVYINCVGGVKTPEPDKTLKVYGQFPSGEVDVVDELCIIVKKSSKLYFDESALTHFHFYAVDLSLSSLSKGLKNYVINASAIHHSNGSSSLSKGKDIYWREFKSVHKKWKNIFNTVVTTTGFWNGELLKTFYTEEEKAEPKVTSKESSKTAQTLQILSSEAVELRAPEEGEWMINGVSMKSKAKTFMFKPQFQGLHKVTHQANQKISDWWIQTIASNQNYITGMCQSFHTHQLGEIFGTKQIVQEVISDRANLSKVELFVGTFRRKNSCNLSVHIEDENGAHLRSAYLDSMYARDNDWNEFTFTPIPDSKNRKLRIKIFSPDASPNNALTVYYVNHLFSFGNLYQNQRKVSGCLSFRLLYAP